jgi:hypothetical protein
MTQEEKLQEIQDRLRHFYGQTDGSYLFPDSQEGDLLKLVHRYLNPQTLYIITGLPGSGKSTLAFKMFQEDKIDTFYEADMWMRDGDGEYEFDPKKLGYCHGKCFASVQLALEKGFNVAQSNTNLTKKEVRPYIEMAKDLNVNIEIIHQPQDVNYGSIHGIPEEKLLMMAARREFFTLKDF